MPKERLNDENAGKLVTQEAQGWNLLNHKFMRIFFQDNIEAAQLLLDIILDRKDLTVKSSKTEQYIEGIMWKSVVLDIFAVDDEGNEYDIEIQRENKGASQRRARHNSAMLDSHMLKSGQSADELRDSYVIFITENDKFGKGQPIYVIERQFVDNGEKFNDGSHIIYVNAKNKDMATELGRLMHDMQCEDPDKMYFELLATRTRFFKQTKEGEKQMKDLIDTWMDEAREEGIEQGVIKKQTEVALSLIGLGTLSVDKIAEVTGLTVDKVNELAATKAG